MTYVLVSLVGDEATQESNRLALWLAHRRRPAALFCSEHPDHAAVQAAAERTGLGLIFAHDGGNSLRARSKGPPWAKPEQIGNMFRRARVYAYACETMGARFREDVEAFGHRACDQGVAVFAGHCGWATADWIESNEELDDAIKNALADVVWTFLDGENDAAKLRLRAEQSFDIVDRGFAAGVPFALHRMMQGLLVTGP